MQNKKNILHHTPGSVLTITCLVFLGLIAGVASVQAGCCQVGTHNCFNTEDQFPCEGPATQGTYHADQSCPSTNDICSGASGQTGAATPSAQAQELQNQKIQAEADKKALKLELSVPLPGQPKTIVFKPTQAGDQLQFPQLAQFIGQLYQFSIGLAALLAVMMIMYGGVLWIASAGKQQAVSKGKEYVISALTGLLLALFSYVILYTVNPELVALKTIGGALVPDLATPLNNRAERKQVYIKDNVAAVDKTGCCEIQRKRAGTSPTAGDGMFFWECHASISFGYCNTLYDRDTFRWGDASTWITPTVGVRHFPDDEYDIMGCVDVDVLYPSDHSWYDPRSLTRNFVNDGERCAVKQ